MMLRRTLLASAAGVWVAGIGLAGPSPAGDDHSTALPVHGRERHRVEQPDRASSARQRKALRATGRLIVQAFAVAIELRIDRGARVGDAQHVEAVVVAR